MNKMATTVKMDSDISCLLCKTITAVSNRRKLKIKFTKHVMPLLEEFLPLSLKLC